MTSTPFRAHDVMTSACANDIIKPPKPKNRDSFAKRQALKETRMVMIVHIFAQWNLADDDTRSSARKKKHDAGGFYCARCFQVLLSCGGLNWCSRASQPRVYYANMWGKNVPPWTKNKSKNSFSKRERSSLF